MIKKGDEIELEIESLAFGAEGVGHLKTEEGALAVFVEDTVPGDVVKVRIGTRKRNFARGYVIGFIKNSTERITPRCRHFAQCGGCALQYLGYADQLKIKEQQVRDALKRIGGFDEKLVLPIIGCKEPWYYRNKMEFSFSRTPEGVLSLGLHVRRRHHDLVELTECFLLNNFVGGLATVLRDFFRQIDSQKRIPEEMKMVSLVVREGKNTGEIMLNLIVENGEPDFCDEFVLEVRKALEGRNLVSVYLTQIMNFKGRPKKLYEKVLWGGAVIHEELKMENGRPLKFELSPQAFFQPNTMQAETLYDTALRAAGLTGNEVVFDLFCGTGSIGIFCAHAAKNVFGIELNVSAVDNARSNAAMNGITNIKFLAGDVAKMLPMIKAKPDVAIIDPPRGGMDGKTVELVTALPARRLVYVSCNPATLARDLKMLTKTGRKLLSVQPVDMFPQTSHIECVALIGN